MKENLKACKLNPPNRIKTIFTYFALQTFSQSNGNEYRANDNFFPAFASKFSLINWPCPVSHKDNFFSTDAFKHGFFRKIVQIFADYRFQHLFFDWIEGKDFVKVAGIQWSNFYGTRKFHVICSVCSGNSGRGFTHSSSNF